MPRFKILQARNDVILDSLCMKAPYGPIWLKFLCLGRYGHAISGSLWHVFKQGILAPIPNCPSCKMISIFGSFMHGNDGNLP